MHYRPNGISYLGYENKSCLFGRDNVHNVYNITLKESVFWVIFCPLAKITVSKVTSYCFCEYNILTRSIKNLYYSKTGQKYPSYKEPIISNDYFQWILL